MWIDITKFLTIAVIVHLLLYSVDEYGDLFDEAALKLFLYITFGLVIYHLIIRKLVDKYIIHKTVQAETEQLPEIKQKPKQKIVKKEIKKTKKPILRKQPIKKNNNKKVSFKE
jgi:hypothetical protein